MDKTRTVISEFWRRMNVNDWVSAAALFSRDCTVDWPQSRERIRGAANFIALNSAYPAKAPWRFEVRSLVVDGETGITETAVSSGDVRAIAISTFTVRDGQITHIREFWPDPYDAPDWRAQWVEML